MSKRSLIPVLLIVAAVLGCSWLRDLGSANAENDKTEANTAANTASAVNTESAPITRENPAADIDAMADKFLAQKSFRAKMLGFGEKDIKTDMEFVAPDRFRIQTGPGLETIVIGKDVYISMGNSFQKIPGAMGDNIPDLRSAFSKEGRKWFSDVRYIGEETVDGKPAYVYEYKNKGEGNIGENDSKIWVSKADGLPLRVESRYKSGNLKSMVIEYEYDPNIKIEVPTTK